MLRATFAVLLLAATCIADSPAGQAQQEVFRDGASRPPKYASQVREALRKAEIIPTVLDDFTPTAKLPVFWAWPGTSKLNISADLGKTLDPSLLKARPSAYLAEGAGTIGISITGLLPAGEVDDSGPLLEPEKRPVYVLTVTDPDAPSRDEPKWSEFCHWIVSARTGDHAREIVEYKPPAPPEKTGKHRYVFTVWAAANGTMEDLVLEAPEGRKRWGYGKGERDAGRVGVRKWAEAHGLAPVAANFFYAQNEEQ